MGFLSPISPPPSPECQGLGLRALARDGGGGWGRREEGKTGRFLSPPLSLGLLGLRAGSPGAVVSEADRSVLSFLPAGEGVELAREQAQALHPCSSSLGPQGLSVPLNPDEACRGPSSREGRTPASIIGEALGLLPPCSPPLEAFHYPSHYTSSL